MKLTDRDPEGGGPAPPRAPPASNSSSAQAGESRLRTTNNGVSRPFLNNTPALSIGSLCASEGRSISLPRAYVPSSSPGLVGWSAAHVCRGLYPLSLAYGPCP